MTRGPALRRERDVERIRSARRICVIGCSGAGKSTLARSLGERLALPVVHFDQLHFLPGWVEREPADTQARVNAAVTGDRWITDGNFKRYSDERFARADLVIWLDYPRRICMRRVLKRVWTTRGVVRPDMAPDCPERLDPAFLAWVWNWPRDERWKNLELAAELEIPLVWLHHPTEAERLLRAL